jgi:hypothetical protein
MSVMEKTRPDDLPGELTFSAVLSGSLNGEAVDVRGDGTINEDRGLTDGRYDIRRLPNDLDSRSLGAFLLTGYPNSCATRYANVGNPFSGGGYHYLRIYAFDSGEEITLNMRCELSADSHLTSSFVVSGNAPSLGGVRDIASIHELWAPSESNIDGKFEVSWLGHRPGAIVATATATSCYSPVEVKLLGGEQHCRLLDLHSTIDASGDLVIVQRSKLIEASEARP